jgi:hypothetical protein
MTPKSCLSNKPKMHSTRCSPKFLENLVKDLNSKQKQTVRKMGFGGLLEVKCGQLDSCIWTKLVQRLTLKLESYS